MHTQIGKYVDLIRLGGRAASRKPFAGGDAIVEACASVEQSGMPASYRISATALQYATCDDTEEMTVTLARHVGDPRVAPTPPVWPVLALLLLGWRHTLSAEHVVQRAAEVRADQQVIRGLAIVAHLFPELQGWLGAVPSRIPPWERAWAVPLVARKLARLHEMES